jgi:hypothetical protein
MAVCGTGNMSRISALRQLYNPMPTGGKEAASSDVVDVPEEVVQARMEEKEVLLAMFGFVDDDDEAAAEFSNTEDENILDVVLPITAYEPPERYDSHLNFSSIDISCLTTSSMSSFIVSKSPVV